MADKITIKCPHCSNEEWYDIPVEGRKCKYCRQPIIIQSLREAREVEPTKRGKIIATLTNLVSKNPQIAEAQLALGLFYLENKAYQFAIPQLKKVIDIDPMNADTYFYLAIALLGGKRPFSQLTPTIKSVCQQLSLAESIEPKAIYYYLHAFVTFDFYKRKFLNVSPSYQFLLDQARIFGITKQDENELFDMLKILKPQDF